MGSASAPPALRAPAVRGDRRLRGGGWHLPPLPPRRRHAPRDGGLPHSVGGPSPRSDAPRARRRPGPNRPGGRHRHGRRDAASLTAPIGTPVARGPTGGEHGLPSGGVGADGDGRGSGGRVRGAVPAVLGAYGQPGRRRPFARRAPGGSSRRRP